MPAKSATILITVCAVANLVAVGWWKNTANEDAVAVMAVCHVIIVAATILLSVKLNRLKQELLRCTCEQSSIPKELLQRDY